MVERSQFSHKANCVKQSKNELIARKRKIRWFVHSRDSRRRKSDKLEGIVIPAGKNQRLNSVLPSTTEKCISIIGSRVGSRVCARGWWQFRLNREYAGKFGRVTHPKSRPVHDAVIKFRTTLPRSVKNLLLRAGEGHVKRASVPRACDPESSKTKRRTSENKMYASVQFSKASIRKCLFYRERTRPRSKPIKYRWTSVCDAQRIPEVVHLCTSTPKIPNWNYYVREIKSEANISSLSSYD